MLYLTGRLFGREYLDKRAKEAVNLVAKASGEGRAIVRPNIQVNYHSFNNLPLIDLILHMNQCAWRIHISINVQGGGDYGVWDMTVREREVATKFVKLIQEQDQTS